jgi:signal transduction histidine kinase
MTGTDPAGGAYTSPRSISWPALWRGGLLTLAIGFVLSTQFLFQFDLYQNWLVPDILLGWLDHLLDQLIVGGCVFGAIALAVLVPVRAMAQQHALALTAITVSALAGEALLLLRLPLPPDISLSGVLFAKVARWVVVAGLGYAFFVFQRQAAQASTQMHENELQRIQAEQQLAEARLQSLHAQVEPHFLFNTLATVQRLYRTEPDRGRKMLASFVTYVREALSQMREEETTLGQEVDLAKAYLDVLQVRMGDRLRVRFDIPSEIARLPFPPLALSTLTENAIKHGLMPLPEGGAIEFTARVQNGQLKVGVADTGAGLRMSSGTGSGLANLRARLAALYGDMANLEFEANVPHGIRATIAVPVRSQQA